MNTPIESLPVAWLRPLPEGYVIPLWRWVLLPATALMLKGYGGVWVNGTLDLTARKLRFTQAGLIKSARRPPESWAIALDTISDVTTRKGIASETVDVHHETGSVRLMTARSGQIVEQLKQVLPKQSD